MAAMNWMGTMGEKKEDPAFTFPSHVEEAMRAIANEEGHRAVEGKGPKPVERKGESRREKE